MTRRVSKITRGYVWPHRPMTTAELAVVDARRPTVPVYWSDALGRYVTFPDGE
jgi:hypothetical protein